MLTPVMQGLLAPPGKISHKTRADFKPSPAISHAAQTAICCEPHFWKTPTNPRFCSLGRWAWPYLDCRGQTQLASHLTPSDNNTLGNASHRTYISLVLKTLELHISQSLTTPLALDTLNMLWILTGNLPLSNPANWGIWAPWPFSEIQGWVEMICQILDTLLDSEHPCEPGNFAQRCVAGNTGLNTSDFR